MFRSQPEFNFYINGKPSMLTELCSLLLALVRYQKLSACKNKRDFVKKSPLAVDLDGQRFLDSYRSALASISVVVREFKRLRG